MAISETKINKYNSAFLAVEKNDLRELMKIVASMINLKYSEKCPVEDSPFYGSGLIHAAACHGSPETITFLLNKGCKINLKGYMGKTPMHWAIADRKKNVFETLQILLQTKGVNINAQDADGDTLLHYAVCRDIKIVELLIKNNAKINPKNIWGETPLHVAAERGDIHMMKYLLSHKADIEARDNNGYTPLRHALFGRNPEKSVAFLLDSGANPTDPDNEGNTTLHCATQSNEDETVRLLIKAGADRSICNKQGFIAANLAGTPEMSAKLRPPKRKTKKTPKDMSKPAPVRKTVLSEKPKKRIRSLPKKVLHTQQQIFEFE